jgi:predicted glycoside hydrolase/deacetylase ChbG (UPF0249 family)
MIRLLVTADDFGSGPGRNAGIVAAFRDGIVTGASLLANGAAFTDAVELAQAHALPLGVHLNLSEGASLSGVISGITDHRGNFPGKGELRQALQAGRFDSVAVRREFSAQLERVRSAGIVPEHLDSHQHCHLFPALTEILAETARAAGIRAVRLPLPAEAVAHDPPGPLGSELAHYRRLAPSCAATLRRAGLATPDGLYGMPLLNHLDEAALLRLLAALPDGTWELMTHPGEPDPGQPFSGPERAVELQALTAPAVRAAIARRGIALTGYRELACAS